jgi:hypothetical protein
MLEDMRPRTALPLKRSSPVKRLAMPA